MLEQALVKRAGSRDFFDVADGQSEGIFEGVKLGYPNVQVDDSALLLCVPWSVASHSPSTAFSPGLLASRDHL